MLKIPPDIKYTLGLRLPVRIFAEEMRYLKKNFIGFFLQK
jgi:hypothetical protein